MLSFPSANNLADHPTRPQVSPHDTIREERGFSQQEVAHRADLHPTWLSHLESGRANPSWGTVRRVAVAPEVQVSELARLAERLEDR